MLLSTILIRYPSLHTLLWGAELHNVFHGSRLMDLGRTNSMSSDASDALLALEQSGYIKPTLFNPSVSEAAILGLSHPTYKDSHRQPPNPGNAFAWDWQVLRELRQDEQLTDP